MTPPKKILKKVKVHVDSVLLPILYILLLFLVATIIYLYSNGYRFDIFKKNLIQSGVVSVESSPITADLYIDNKLVGKTPKSSSLTVGTYNVTLKMDGYYDWNKTIDIVEGKSTPLSPWLVKTNPTSTVEWTSTGTLEKYWVSPNHSHTLILTKETSEYILWEYTLNPVLWDFSSNPSVLLHLTSNDIDISLSPNGQLALLKLANGTTSQYYLLDTNTEQTIANLKQLTIDSQQTYTITWGNDNEYLILESTEGIYAYNVRVNTSTKLITKLSSQKYIWSTDTQGFFYIAENVPEQDEVYTYHLKQLSLDGTNSKYIIDNFYFGKRDEYIYKYRSEGFASVEFTSSPESTLSVGELDSIVINQEAQGVLMKTSYATYWYNISNQKFMMISPYPASLIDFDSTNQSLFFNDGIQIGLFTFDKTEGDYTTLIGAKELKNIADLSKVSNLQWLAEDLNIAYTEEGSIFVADKDGSNKNLIAKPTNLLAYLLQDSQGAVITFCTDEQNKVVITEYDIH